MDWLETDRFERAIAKSFPEGATVRMSVEGFHHTDHRAVHSSTLPILGPSFLWKSDPGLDPFEICLDIGLLSVRLLNIVAFGDGNQLSGVLSLGSDLPIGTGGLWLGLALWCATPLVGALLLFKNRKI